MATTSTLPLQQRLGIAWGIPVAAYWLWLYVATRNADPMAFPIIFSASVLVPFLNLWVLFVKSANWFTAVAMGLLLPVAAALFLTLW
jgi:hypothetical protein